MTRKQMNLERIADNKGLAFKAAELVNERGLRVDELEIDLGHGDKYQIGTGGRVTWDDLETILSSPADTGVVVWAEGQEGSE